MSESPTVSVIVLTHNHRACTARCLRGLLETRGPQWELIVVDNGSTDGTREWLPTFRDEALRHGVDVKLTFNEGNHGCSTARNQGIALAEGRDIVFADNDVAVCHTSWLDVLSRRLRSTPLVGMVSPKIIYPFPPYRIQCAGVAVSPTGRVQFRGRGRERYDPAFTTATETQALISACVMVRKELLDELGGFDEAFNPVEYEDIDLCYRIRAAGYQTWFEPAAEMYHFESVTTTGTPSLPNTYLIIKHGLRFKKRWRAMFEKEAGPDDDDTQWQTIHTPPLDAIPDPPIIDNPTPQKFQHQGDAL